ncbi:MAG: hypothetical protein NT075_26160 [Chloroflexi bacterium]|nr:hypothetical protein [Chloroflexota bacterium]
MIDWMAKLATHYAQMRQKYPDDQLLIVFDIDGTMLDLRHMMLHVLQGYDRAHSTAYFQDLTLNDIDVHEYVIDRLLARFPLPEQAYVEIEQWYRARYWSSETIEVSHYAYPGVMDIIRWFQLQPHTHVALNTGRYEVLRADTLRSLNRLGQAYNVQFRDDQLFMRADEWTEALSIRKIAGIRHFQAQGYRIFAFVENEPANLAAVASLQDDDILLLHPDTIYLSGLAELPPNVFQGVTYDLTEFLPETALPADLQLIWHGVNDPINLRQFLSSAIEWAEFDVNVDPTGQTLILRHDTFAERPYAEGECWLTLEAALAQARQWNKAVKLDFKVGGDWIEQTLAVVEKYGFANTQLWFNGEVALLDESWIRHLAKTYPGAIVQIPIGFLRQLLSKPTALRSQIESYRTWGINRFSVNWTQPEARQLFAHLTEWGCEVNFYGIPDLAAFLQAVLWQARSLTCDFNFPKWGYYGRGSGHQGLYHQYTLLPTE